MSIFRAAVSNPLAWLFAPRHFAIKRPFFGSGLCCANGNEQALCRASIGTDSSLKVTD